MIGTSERGACGNQVRTNRRPCPPSINGPECECRAWSGPLNSQKIVVEVYVGAQAAATRQPDGCMFYSGTPFRAGRQTAGVVVACVGVGFFRRQETAVRCCLLLFAARSVRHALGAVGIVLGLAFLAPAGAEGLPLNSVVRFNTVCANCHEAQCSGRLAFGSGAEAARGHMERYLGPLTDDEVGFLFRILRHQGALRLSVAERVPSDLVWTEADLEPWRNAQEGGCLPPWASSTRAATAANGPTSRSAALPAEDQRRWVLSRWSRKCSACTGRPRSSSS
jgi:hypothetical protein